MSDNLCQNGLGFVPKGVVRRLISVRGELEWLLELPLEVQRQAHRNLITCESTKPKSSVTWKFMNRSPRTYPSSAFRIDFRRACTIHGV
jgi:hypothetical protein